MARIEDHIAVGGVIAGAGILGLDFDGAVSEFAAVGSIEGVQPLMVFGGAVFRHGHHVDGRVRVLGSIDDGCRGDSDLRVDVGALPVVGGGFSGLESGDLPQVRTGVSVIGVDGAVLGGDDEEIVSDAGNGHG